MTSEVRQLAGEFRSATVARVRWRGVDFFFQRVVRFFSPPDPEDKDDGSGSGSDAAILASVGLAAKPVALALFLSAARAMALFIFIILMPVLSVIACTTFSARDGSLEYNSSRDPSAIATMASTFSSVTEAAFLIANAGVFLLVLVSLFFLNL